MKKFVFKFDEDEEDLASGLEHILSLVREGCTSGYYPTWYIEDIE